MPTAPIITVQPTEPSAGASSSMHLEGVGERQLVAAVAARHERAEAPGGNEVVDEVAGQRAGLLDLVDASRDLRHQGAHRIECRQPFDGGHRPVASDH